MNVFLDIKGSSDQSHFIFEINFVKGRIRHKTTMNLNDIIFNRFIVDIEIHHLESFYVGSDSTSGIDLKIKWLGSELPLS